MPGGFPSKFADERVLRTHIQGLLAAFHGHQNSLSISRCEPLVRGRITNSRSSPARVRSRVSTRVAAEVSRSETVRCRTPTLAANFSCVKPSSRRRCRMEFASCWGIRAMVCISLLILYEFFLGAFSSNIILGVFPPVSKLGGFSHEGAPMRKSTPTTFVHGQAYCVV